MGWGKGVRGRDVPGHTSGSSVTRGSSEIPSGRFPSDLLSPAGSLQDRDLGARSIRTPHDVVEQAVAGVTPCSLLLLQAKPMRAPRASTGTPHVHVCGCAQVGAETQTHSHPDDVVVHPQGRPELISAALEARPPTWQ